MPYRIRMQTGLAVALTAIAGYVDAVGYLTLGQVYVANMSGNSITAGVGLAEHHTASVLERLWTVGAFFAGLLACRILMEVVAARGRPVRAWLPLSLEWLLLALFALGSAQPAPLRVFLVASAMGFQNATITYFGQFRVFTGFVTGTLTKLAVRLASWLVWVTRKLRRMSLRRVRRVVALSVRRRPMFDAMWLASIWSAYLAGAAGGALLLERWHSAAMVVPCLVLAPVILADLAVGVSRRA